VEFLAEKTSRGKYVRPTSLRKGFLFQDSSFSLTFGSWTDFLFQKL
jgi:hypothetical protein